MIFVIFLYYGFIFQEGVLNTKNCVVEVFSLVAYENRYIIKLVVSCIYCSSEGFSWLTSYFHSKLTFRALKSLFESVQL